MLSDNQQIKIQNRILNTVKLFFENEGKINDVHLARLLTIAGYETSSSTVGRDLVSQKYKELIGEEQYNLILTLREKNKQIGTVKGGQNSILKNNVAKNEKGHFMGCEKRKM